MNNYEKKMQPKELSFQDDEFYSHRFLGGPNHVYSFITVSGVVYEVRFKPTGYIFGEVDFAPCVFEFSLLLVHKPKGPVKIASDLRIPNTVIRIFLYFFEQHSRNVCIYICDSSDLKQNVRKRKFDRWFDDYNNGDFTKLNEKLVAADGTEFPVSLIMRVDHPQRKEIADAFFELASNLNDEK